LSDQKRLHNFLYHSAIFDRLGLIAQNGLTTPRKHGFETDYDMPYYSQKFPDRLYLWETEDAALNWAIDMGLVALRFPREVIRANHLVRDRAFPGSRRRFFPGWYVDATVPGASLQACEGAEWNDRLGRVVAVSWIPLMTVKKPTHRTDLP
jgi:hypothetical protein